MPAPQERPLPSTLTLVLGGARSGKSRHAERLVLDSGLAPVYVATGEPLDDEMAARIARHRARRGVSWRTVEEPLELSGVLLRECNSERAVLVDCLTLWVSNLMIAKRPVCDASTQATSSGVPVATTSPPASPPSGPRSTT